METSSSFLRTLVILPVRAYQVLVSPLFPPSCRHVPTCSQYMVEAIGEWGITKGVPMGLKRLARCHPWGTSGYDPIPRKPSAPVTSTSPAGIPPVEIHPGYGIGAPVKKTDHMEERLDQILLDEMGDSHVMTSIDTPL